MYFCLDLDQVSDEAEDWLSHAVFEWGAQGMSEVLSFHQEEGEEAVETVANSIHHLHVYFEKCPDAEFMQEVALRYPEIKWRLLEESDQDWLAEWKKGFHPFELVDGIYIVPTWLRPPEQAKRVIWMDPGMAFGTGTHETTQLVAQALARGGPFRQVLDVGTGTGILAILAKLLGAESVVGIDTESEALRVARENAVANQMEVHIVEQSLERIDGKFDVVMANIIDGTLIRIQKDLFNCVAKPGWLILSGILVERESHFLEHFKLPEGAAWSERTVLGDWICRRVRF